MVQEAFKQGARLPPYSEVYDPKAFLVEEGLVDLAGAGVQIDGCPVLHRNLCRASPGVDRADALVVAMNHMARHVGAGVAASGDLLLMFEGSGPAAASTGTMRRIFCLLSDASYKPQSQVYTMCDLCGSCETSEHMSYPFELVLATEASRLSVPSAPDSRSLAHRTSDELASMAVKLAHSWRIVALHYNIVSTMRMKVDGLAASVYDSALRGDGVRRQAEARQKEINAVLSLNSFDPFAPAPVARRPRRVPQPRAASAAGQSAREPASDAPTATPAPLMGLAAEEGDESGQSDADVPAMIAGTSIDAGLVELSACDLLAAAPQTDLLGDEPLRDEGAPPFDVDRADGVLVEGVLAASSSSEPAARPVGSGLPVGPAAAAMPDVSDVVSSVVESLANAMGSSAGAGPDASAALAASASASDRPDPQAQASTIATASAPSRVDVGTPVDGGPPGWTMSAKGYIFDETRRFKGRLTRFGKNLALKGLAGKSQCVQHSWATEGQMLLWLESGFDDQLKPRRPQAGAASSAKP